MKIRVLRGIYNQLAHHVRKYRILCGDFNTPQAEKFDGKIVTWGQKERNGEIVTNDLRWDVGERQVLEGLQPYDLIDIYRHLHGYKVKDFSWFLRRKGRIIAKRRFDHVYASVALNPIECRYIHLLRENGLSDHSPVLAVFHPRTIWQCRSISVH
jgi:exonuclease III